MVAWDFTSCFQQLDLRIQFFSRCKSSSPRAWNRICCVVYRLSSAGGWIIFRREWKKNIIFNQWRSWSLLKWLFDSGTLKTFSLLNFCCSEMWTGRLPRQRHSGTLPATHPTHKRNRQNHNCATKVLRGGAPRWISMRRLWPSRKGNQNRFYWESTSLPDSSYKQVM